jgi:hypothetical protein
MAYKRISPIPVIEGGTQLTTWGTAFGLLCAGTTVTNPVQVLASLGATGTILTSQGAGALPTWTTAVYPSTTTINQILYSSAANNVVGLATANSSVLITSAGGIPSLSQTLPSAVQGNITSVGTITSGTWNGSVIGLTYGGTNANLTAANGGIFYSTATAGAILAPTATANQVLLSGSNTTPAWSSATYPATTTINQILYSSSNNVIVGLSTANQAVLTTGTGGVPVLTSIATNGQLIIGSTAGAPAAATLTAGSGITITNAANSITIASTTGSLTWTDVTGATQTLAAANGYITNRSGGVTYTLPASGTLGDLIRIVGLLGLSTIAQNANQQIVTGSDSSTIGASGTVVGTNVGDCIELICITAGASTVWRTSSMMGNWTTT